MNKKSGQLPMALFQYEKLILSVEETHAVMDGDFLLRPFHTLRQAAFTAVRRKVFCITAPPSDLYENGKEWGADCKTIRNYRRNEER